MSLQPEPRTLVYKTVGQLEIPLDLYLPDAKNVPILIWFHGGGLLMGSRKRIAPHLLNAVRKYNIALVSADYRLAPQVGVADIYEDVHDCVAFVRTQLSSHVDESVLDSSRLAISGSSAGGYLALLAGLYVDPKPRVILPIYSITDPLGTFFTNPQPHPMGGGHTDPGPLASFIDSKGEVVANNDPASKRSNMYSYMLQEANLASLLHFTGVPDTQDKWRVAKQIYVYKLPPSYVVHGDADTAVGVEQADEVVGVMVGMGGVEVRYERLRGVNHLFDFKSAVEMEGMYEFMCKYL